MGFLDKAKQLADQAHQKLDEVQKDFNKQSTGQQQQGDAPAVEYDKHGRPVQPSEPEAPVAPPAAEQPAPPPQAAPPGEPAQQAEPAPPPQAAPPPTPAPAPAPAPSASGDEEGEDDPDAPPKMTSGDPLAG
jgi:hypothetical protein